MKTEQEQTALYELVKDSYTYKHSIVFSLLKYAVKHMRKRIGDECSIYILMKAMQEKIS